MIKTYEEIIPTRKDQMGEIVPEHTVVYNYDTDDIKNECGACGKFILGEEDRYLKMGNFCPKCNAKKW